LIWTPFLDEVNDRRLPLQLQRGIPLHNKHDATSRTSEPTSENSVHPKFKLCEVALFGHHPRSARRSR
jgi:hypothetical protein